MALEFFLPASQGCLIGLDLMEAPADFRRFQCGHAAMLVEFNWVVHHRRLPFTLCTFPVLRSPRNRANVKRRKDCPAATHLGPALMGRTYGALQHLRLNCAAGSTLSAAKMRCLIVLLCINAS
jgi:hypothetical protein